jgi:peptidoglycan/LPS O-acetylase OafA/YrhL
MRNERLDILRCIAVVLVLIHHAHISFVFTQVGWAGVDLFFVLSGFLISGLLFSEYKKYCSIGFKRFFIRRGLKIYPAFYVFLLLTEIVSYGVFHRVSSPTRLLHDIFFVQNYEQGTWDHLWTLAVEEHFYIFLPVFLLVLVWVSSNRENPFRILPWASFVIATLCVALRAASVYIGKPNFHMTYTASHERVDSLFFGVLLGYHHHFRPLALDRLVQPTRNRLAIAAVSATLLSFTYLLPRESKFFATWGYTFVYLGFGGVLLLSLNVRGILAGRLAGIAQQVGKAFALVGMYSYSIYLWHGPCGAWLPGLMRRTIGFPTGQHGRFAVYFAGSLVVGITMSRLIEYPILRLRDRLFPAAQVSHAPATVSRDPADRQAVRMAAAEVERDGSPSAVPL